MNLYITNGTFEFLQKVKEKFINEKIILIGDIDVALLLHETSGETVFKEPRVYEVIDAVGNYENAHFVVMNHIPVTEEGRPLFEHRFKNRDGAIEKQPGFSGIRVLRPLSGNTYVILTLWETESAFKNWKQSEAFGKSHNKSAAEIGTDNQIKIFSGASYTTQYPIPDVYKG